MAVVEGGEVQARKWEIRISGDVSGSERGNVGMTEREGDGCASGGGRGGAGKKVGDKD